MLAALLLLLLPPSQLATSPCDCSLPLGHYSQDSPLLVEAVRTCHLLPPAAASLPYNFSQEEPNIRGQTDQPYIVDLLYNQTNFPGFFIEAGAWDGEQLTNTLLLEKLRGWSGLLVEPSREAFLQLGGKARKAWSSGTCLSSEARVTEGRLSNNNMLGGVSPGLEGEGEAVLCLPLYSLLLALGSPAVHYLSLDMEGVELDVLRTLPWDKVDIWVISVETNHAHNTVEPHSWTRQQLIDFLEERGYRWLGTAGGELHCPLLYFS